MTDVSITVADGRTVKEFVKLLEARQTYMKETTDKACAAIAIDALRSIRAATKKLKPKTAENEASVKPVALYPSFKTVGPKKRKFCLRYKGSNSEYHGNEIIVQIDRASDSKVLKTYGVYSFVMQRRNKKKAYLLVAPSEASALRWAKLKKRRMAMVFSGLARRALTTLMMKTATVNVGDDGASQLVHKKADENTRKTVSITQGLEGIAYSLTLEDNLDYAMPAVDGGEWGVNLALQKALNKVTATINQKCKNLLTFDKLETPFPELKQRK
jgi:hypothetical protein